MIELERAYLPDNSATFGRLVVNDQAFCTLEPPWRGNEQKRSCIPEGVYPLQLRESPIVRRTSAGAYFEGWEVADVPERSFIMFHVGNWARDTEGCILVGENFSWSAGNGPMVTNSRAAFSRFMLALANRDFWDIRIFNKTAEYP